MCIRDRDRAEPVYYTEAETSGTFLKEEVRFHRGERMKFGRESGKKMDKRGGGRPDRSSVSSQMSPVRRYSDRAADCLLGLPEKRTADPGTAL